HLLVHLLQRYSLEVRLLVLFRQATSKQFFAYLMIPYIPAYAERILSSHRGNALQTGILSADLSNQAETPESIATLLSHHVVSAWSQEVPTYMDVSDYRKCHLPCLFRQFFHRT